MSGKYTGVTFAMQKVSPSDDAIIRRAILPDGKLTGCDISYSGSTLTMSAGHLMVCGRQIRNPAAQNWPVVDATSGFARLVLTIDLTRTATKETFDQVVDSIEYATSKDGFVMLEQADINGAGTRYQVAVCTVSLGAGGITGIVSQLEKCEVGAGLNFKLVGGTAQPADAKENTIWVNTDEEIHGWAFAPENPFLQKTGELYKAGSAKGYFDSAGNVVDSQYLTVTPSISLPDGATSVTVTTGEVDLDDVYHVFYNKSGAKVSTVRYASGTTAYPVPDGAVSIRLSIHESNTPGIFCEYVTCEGGAAWIKTGDNGSTAFNVLKKNIIQIFPVSAMQYVSGKFIEVPVKIYQNGSWNEPINEKYAFNYGDLGSSGGYSFVPSGCGAVTEDSIAFKCLEGYAYSNAKFDIDAFSTMTVQYKTDGFEELTAGFVKNVGDTDFIASVSGNSSNVADMALELGSISGDYHVALKAETTTSHAHTADVYMVHLGMR